jgi:diguanylate cyclase (GGDEF)-like protein
MHDPGPNEARRLDELNRYEILDTAAEEAFDDLVRLASAICGTPIATISLVDAERQWFKARVGLDADQTPREHSFCAHAIREPGVFIVPDARDDPRFAANPLVTGEPNIRFYAGAPLISPMGWPLGTLCVIDRVPRELAPGQVEALRVLGRQVVAQFELRLHILELRRMQELLQHSHDDMERRIAERTSELARSNRELQIEVDQRAAAEARLLHEATHDALTGLANRTLLHDRRGRAIADGGERSLALLLLDLDRFKEINNTFGHHYGDVVLRGIEPRLRGGLPEDSTIARLGGDEFGVLLPGTDEAGAVRAADEALRRLSRPIEVDGQRLDIGGTFGIALYPEHGQDANTLLRKADVAMYAAKRARSGHAVYADAQATSSPRRLSLIADLRHGIEDGHLLLHYQPKIALAAMRPCGCEALVRWRHPVVGMIAPGEFIPLAEHTGLIRPIGLWTLDAAMGQAKKWSRSGMDAHVAVNLGTESLQDQGLAATVARVLGRHDTPPSRLTLEITESAMMADPERAMGILREVHDLGVRVSIDDFGTGYSSLAYLKGLPADEVKVDRTFVKGMATNDRDACIVRSVIELGHNLGLRVVAEGVEDRATVRLLAEAGCDYAQGFYFSRPLAPGDYAGWMAAPLAL